MPSTATVEKPEKLPVFGDRRDTGSQDSALVLAWPAGPRRVELPLADAHLWSARLDAGGEQVQRCWEVLAEDERQRADRFRFASDRQHFLVARGVLRILLGRYLGIPGSAVRFEYGAFGKPALGGVHNCDLQFNLAHSGNLAVYAFTCVGRAGIDVETDRAARLMQGVPESSFTPAEQRALAALPVDCRPQAFVALWTRKEAYLKALGLGLQAGLATFEMSVPPATAALMRRAQQDQNQGSWFFQNLQPAPHFWGTLCLENSAAVQFWSWQEF